VVGASFSSSGVIHLHNMKLGILGTRGIPNAYGGFEQFAQYLSQGLVRRGHSVWVYNSSDHPYKEAEWNGVRIIHCADWEGRIGTAGQFIYDYNCLRDARRRGFDVLLQLGYTSNSVWHRIWPRRIPNVVNMDGLEWKRSKYGPLTRKFLARAEGWAARRGDILIADSIGIQDYLEKKYNRPSIFIPYGAEIPAGFDAGRLAQWGLQPGGYFLVMARMEPENNIEMVIRGWMASGKCRPLVLMGNPANSFGQYLVKKYRHERLLFIGAIYEVSVVNALRHYSAVYLHGHSVGGTNPSLIEAMASGCMIAAHDNPFNRAVLNDQAGYFSRPEEVTAILDHEPDRSTQAVWKEKNLEKVKKVYNWDQIIGQYESVLLNSIL
jgi:glycosyltransferase involved in cell wall biosynthesis